MGEIELFNEIKRRYTNLFVLLDDVYEDDKNGKLDAKVENEKALILNLVKKADVFGVEIEKDAEFNELSTNLSLKEWYQRCKLAQKSLEKDQ